MVVISLKGGLLAAIKFSLMITYALLCNVAIGAEQVTLQLKWTHQFQFAGYYMAQQKGFYKEAGLDVAILPADPSNPDTFSKVLSGQADFAVAHSGILQQRIMGKPLVVMAAILQFSPYCWMVEKHSDIFHPRDFIGKRISNISRKENAELLIMLERKGVNIGTLTTEVGGNSSQSWLENHIDAMQVYVTNEPYKMRQQGIEYRLICPQKYGINVYSDILYTSQSVIEGKPEMVRAFYLASLKGWRYAMMNIEESVAITHANYATGKSLAELTYEAEILTDYILPPSTNLGVMSMAKWRLIADLYDVEQISFDKIKKDFIYHHQPPEKFTLSWMLIAAIVFSFLSIPLYIRLMLRKSV